MNMISSLIKRSPLISFFVISFALTWLGWLVPDMIYNGTLISTAITFVFIGMIAGPLLSALIVTAVTEGKAGVITLLRKFTICRVGWGWWLVALLLMPTMALAAIYLNTLYAGGCQPTRHIGEHLARYSLCTSHAPDFDYTVPVSTLLPGKKISGPKLATVHFLQG